MAGINKRLIQSHCGYMLHDELAPSVAQRPPLQRAGATDYVCSFSHYFII